MLKVQGVSTSDFAQMAIFPLSQPAAMWVPVAEPQHAEREAAIMATTCTGMKRVRTGWGEADNIDHAAVGELGHKVRGDVSIGNANGPKLSVSDQPHGVQP